MTLVALANFRIPLVILDEVDEMDSLAAIRLLFKNSALAEVAVRITLTALELDAAVEEVASKIRILADWVVILVTTVLETALIAVTIAPTLEVTVDETRFLVMPICLATKELVAEIIFFKPMTALEVLTELVVVATRVLK